MILARASQDHGSGPSSLLTAAQRRVVSHRGGGLLVLAGPGSGKTSTLVEAMNDRLHGPDSLAPEQVLGLTFGADAAQEWRSRLATRRPDQPIPTISTFHALSLQLVLAAADPTAGPPSLMSESQADRLLRSVLAESAADWPSHFRPALGTVSFANRVRRGFEIVAAMALAGQPAQGPVARAWQKYRQVCRLQHSIDFSGLLVEAVELLRGGAARGYRAVFVDEYQDTDPVQEQLLLALVGPACDVVAVGDPDQAIYRFRGADVSGIGRFPRLFADARSAEPAPVVALDRLHRFGPQIAEPVRSVASGIPLSGIPAAAARAHRASEVAGLPGSIEVRTYDTVVGERSGVAATVADLLASGPPDGQELAKPRYGLQQQPVEPSDVAILVRSRDQIEPMRVALQAEGVPVRLAAGEVPLRDEPGVLPLLEALDLARMVAAGAEPTNGATQRLVGSFLAGPVAGCSAGLLQDWRRQLRRRESCAALAERRAPRTDQHLLAMSVLGHSPVGSGPDCEPPPEQDPLPEGIANARRLLVDAAELVRQQASAGDVLWLIWRRAGGLRHDWAQRLKATALSGTSRAAWANRSLDAIIAVFDRAAPLDGADPPGVRTFLADLKAEEVPSRLPAGGVASNPAVAICTAHAAKGAQWPVVFVVGVQEEVWPSRVMGEGLPLPDLPETAISPAEQLIDERRLFYVALTRAQQRLFVSAVASADDNGPQPSRFLGELGEPAVHITGTAGSRWSPRGLTTRLRLVADDQSHPEPIRAAARERLEILGGIVAADTRPVAPAAPADSWWGNPSPEGQRPVRPTDQPLRVSASDVEAWQQCPLRWFLARELRADTATGPRGTAGTFVHWVAERLAAGDLPLDAGEPAHDSFSALLAELWPPGSFDAQWQAASELQRLQDALDRLFVWFDQRGDAIRDSEFELDVLIKLADEADQAAELAVQLRGRLDVLLQAGEGSQILDFKTGASVPTMAEVDDHLQLRIYQVGLAEQTGEPASGGAGLVHVNAPAGAKDPRSAKVQYQAPLDEVTRRETLDVLNDFAVSVRNEHFPPQTGKWCRSCNFQQMCPTTRAGKGLDR